MWLDTVRRRGYDLKELQDESAFHWNHGFCDAIKTEAPWWEGSCVFWVCRFSFLSPRNLCDSAARLKVFLVKSDNLHFPPSPHLSWWNFGDTGSPGFRGNLSLCYKMGDQHEIDGKWGRSPTQVKTQAECEEPFAPTVSWWLESFLPVQ